MKQLRKVLALIETVLSEVFDEAAYARFLARHRLPRSRESYNAFVREHDAVKQRRPKCC